jgi:hypothetical protein
MGNIVSTRISSHSLALSSDPLTKASRHAMTPPKKLVLFPPARAAFTMSPLGDMRNHAYMAVVVAWDFGRLVP